MKLCVVTCTYNRPHLLARTIACFEAQDYEDRYMVILDDGQQYEEQEGDRWRIVSHPERFASLGAKRNHSLSLVPDDTYAVLPCDDDDLFLPWHLSSAAAALRTADWSRPSLVLFHHIAGGQWMFAPTQTGHQLDPKQERLFHPAWAMRLDRVLEVGGYPMDESGPEDQGLMRKLEAAGVTQADPIELGYKPSFIYCWERGQSISSFLGKDDKKGEKAWASLERKLEPATLDRWEFPFDPNHPIFAPFIRKRPF